MSVSEIKISTTRRQCARVSYHVTEGAPKSVRCLDPSSDKFVELIQNLTFNRIDFELEFTEGDGYSCSSCS